MMPRPWNRRGHTALAEQSPERTSRSADNAGGIPAMCALCDRENAPHRLRTFLAIAAGIVAVSATGRSELPTAVASNTQATASAPSDDLFALPREPVAAPLAAPEPDSATNARTTSPQPAGPDDGSAGA